MGAYNADDLNAMADELDRNADHVTTNSTILGVLLGVFGVVAPAVVVQRFSNGQWLLLCFASMVGGAFGFTFGKLSAARARVEAEMARCAIETEKNTRPGGP